MTALTLFLPYPPTANNLFPTGKSGKRFISPEYAAWKELAHFTLNTQLAATRIPLAPPYAAVYEFRRPDNRRRDVENLAKGVSDALVARGVITDDCKIDELTLRWVRDVPWEVRVILRSVP